FFVDVGSVRAAIVDDEPSVVLPLVEVRVTTAHTVALEDDVVVRPTPDAYRGRIEHESLAEERPFCRIDDDETIRPTALTGLGRLHHLCDACLFVLVAQRDFPPLPGSAAAVSPGEETVSLSDCRRDFARLGRSLKPCGRSLCASSQA